VDRLRTSGVAPPGAVLTGQHVLTGAAASPRVEIDHLYTSNLSAEADCHCRVVHALQTAAISGDSCACPDGTVGMVMENGCACVRLQGRAPDGSCKCGPLSETHLGRLSVDDKPRPRSIEEHEGKCEEDDRGRCIKEDPREVAKKMIALGRAMIQESARKMTTIVGPAWDINEISSWSSYNKLHNFKAELPVADNQDHCISGYPYNNSYGWVSCPRWYKKRTCGLPDWTFAPSKGWCKACYTNEGKTLEHSYHHASHYTYCKVDWKTQPDWKLTGGGEEGDEPYWGTTEIASRMNAPTIESCCDKMIDAYPNLCYNSGLPLVWVTESWTRTHPASIKVGPDDPFVNGWCESIIQCAILPLGLENHAKEKHCHKAKTFGYAREGVSCFSSGVGQTFVGKPCGKFRQLHEKFSSSQVMTPCADLTIRMACAKSCGQLTPNDCPLHTCAGWDITCSSGDRRPVVGSEPNFGGQFVWR
jgi:hypothetical protein